MQITLMPPLFVSCVGDETTILDANDNVVLTADWDGKGPDEHGINDVLFALVDAFNTARSHAPAEAFHASVRVHTFTGRPW